MSFRDIRDAVGSAHYQKQVDPIKEMLIATKNLVQDEIGRHVEGDEHYDVIIKSYGSENEGDAAAEQRKVLEAVEKESPHLDTGVSRKKEHLYKGVGKEELAQLFARVDAGEELTPREIQVLSELANAVQKAEFVINFGDRIVGPEEHTSNIRYDIKNNAAQVAKVKNLGKRKFIGKDESGEIIVGDRQEAGGALYNVLDESVRTLNDAFGGRQGFLDLDPDEIYSAEDLRRMDRAERRGYSEEFERGIADFNIRYPLSERVTYTPPEIEGIETESLRDGIAAHALHSVMNSKESGELIKLATKWSQLIYAIANEARTNDRLLERDKDREARLEEFLDELHTAELDAKQLRILMEWMDFTINIDHLEDPSSLPGKIY